MLLSDFDFDLPETSIALYPSVERSASRLLVLNRKAGIISHKGFADIKECFKPGDLLLLNDTRVIPARLKGKKATGGAAELLLVEEVSQTCPDEKPSAEKGAAQQRWRCMARPAKGLGVGAKVFFKNGITATVLYVEPDGTRVVRFAGLKEGVSAPDVLGEIPLPPYIKRAAKPVDTERYQTVYADKEGAIAAPTAGLHFTPELIEAIEAAGVTVKCITLHVGPGTFLPVRVENVKEHKMLKERYTITADVIEAVKRTKAEGGRVVAVGTTTTRAVEGAWQQCAASASEPGIKGTAKSAVKGTALLTGEAGHGITGATSIFIYPGFSFKVVDALITNFHLPRSTLIMLVSAFAGTELVKKAYAEAVEAGYRFYSYGDAMMIE